MTKLLEALTGDTSALASLISAIVAAAVAFIVLALNQSFSRRQQRVQFLQPKLEEMYLLLNDVSERNARLFDLLIGVVNGDLEAKKHLDNSDLLDVYGHLTAKKMVMIVRLYFPKLSRIHQVLFTAEREVNNLIWKLKSGNPLAQSELIEASGRVGHMVRLMEQEMVSNQDRLLHATVLPRRYKRVTDREIRNVPPPPIAPHSGSTDEAV